MIAFGDPIWDMKFSSLVSKPAARGMPAR
jgi:hypothetical protein